MMASISAVVNLKASAYTIALLKMSVIKFKLLSSSLLINPFFFQKSLNLFQCNWQTSTVKSRNYATQAIVRSKDLIPGSDCELRHK